MCVGAVSASAGAAPFHLRYYVACVYKLYTIHTYYNTLIIYCQYFVVLMVGGKNLPAFVVNAWSALFLAGVYAHSSIGLFSAGWRAGQLPLSYRRAIRLRVRPQCSDCAVCAVSLLSNRSSVTIKS